MRTRILPAFAPSVLASIATLVLVAYASVAAAQTPFVPYFGKNKIHYDTFECDSPYYSGAAQFRLNASGKVGDLLLQLEPVVKPFVFVKR